MSDYRRYPTAGATYFFTVVTFRRQTILCHPEIRAALRQAIHKTREQYPFIIEAWVLMPDHLHTIWTLPSNDSDFSKRWSLIKQYVSHACPQFHREEWMSQSKTKRRESTIWQRRFWEHQIRDAHDFDVHMDYIHYNPVKHGLVNQAADWPFSTLPKCIAQGVYPTNWASAAENDTHKYGE